MHSLREIQRRFVDGLLTGEASDFLPHVAQGGGPTAAERFAIYRGNCREAFLAALEAGYPVLERLAGEAWFRQLARDFQREHPSTSGNLAHAGRHMPAFVARRVANTPYEYFSDVAALEWACQEILAAPDAGPFDFARLGAVAPDDHPRLRFVLHPALRLFSSRFPVVTIWDAHQAGREPEGLDLSSGGEQAVVQRDGAGIAMYRVPPAEYAALLAFRDVRSLRAAVEEALAIDGAFDPGAALRRWAELRFIVDFSIVGESIA